MMKASRTTLAGLAALALLAAPAAQAADQAKERAGFNELDKNKDGKLSRAEARANANILKKFAASDDDKDGFLTRTEYLRTAAAEDWDNMRKNMADFISPDDGKSSGGSSGRK